METPCAVWDFTFSHEQLPDRYEFQKLLPSLFKKWTYQLERSETGYVHYQGRGSLWKKKREHECIKLCKQVHKAFHISRTSNPGMGDVFYVMKEDTRIEGPWSDKDVCVYIPKQYRDIDPYPWQSEVMMSGLQFNSRIVNLVYNPVGCEGKTTVAALCALLHRGVMIPPINDAEKLMATVCDILTSKEEREPGPVFIDLPRYMDKSKLHGIISSIEQIKNGFSYDLRYKYKEWWFDSPPVWCFTNVMLPLESLSRDRWKIWQIEDRNLVPFVPVG